jgi:S1-C subfamily serine protease
MNRKKIKRNHLLLGRGLSRIAAAFIFAIIYICGNLLVGASPVYASGVPGGNISDPVVRSVDIAKPAIVRIVGTITGRLTVDFSTTTRGLGKATFPQGGNPPYTLQYTGSGAFITAHGDILTADHLVHPPPDSLYVLAAQDVADFYNARFPNQFIAPSDVLILLSNGIWKSQAQFDTPSMRAYLSTDYIGPTNAASLNEMPQSTYADVDKIEKTGDFDHGDTAILHVPMEDTPSIRLGDSSNVEPQDQLTILGFPGNGDILTVDARARVNGANPATGFLTMSINKIFVSALKRSAGGAPLIQVGGNVEHGDSGGPALDSDGDIVGIVSFGGTDVPSGTSFLQANQTAQQFINDLQLNTQPGTFQSSWSQTFGLYSSTEAGHWRQAQQQLQQLQNNYPNFRAAQAFLEYATVQANKEAASSLFSPPMLIGVAVLILVVISALMLLQFRTRRRHRLQEASATQAASYQPSYFGAKPSLEDERLLPYGNMAQADLKDGANAEGNGIPNMQLEQSRAMHTMPQASQVATTVAYNAAQSGQHPVVSNQQPMNPWPQPVQHEPAPAYRQPMPYGQQPYNAAQQPGPTQGMPNSPHPAQQQQYAPYPQPTAAPWPPASAAGAPYAPQNPAQQDATTRRVQQPPAYGTPYSQPPQGYGANPAQPRPAQPGPLSRQSSASIPAQPRQVSRPPMLDAAMTSDAPTVRPNRQSTAASEETNKP